MDMSIHVELRRQIIPPRADDKAGTLRAKRDFVKQNVHLNLGRHSCNPKTWTLAP